MNAKLEDVGPPVGQQDVVAILRHTLAESHGQPAGVNQLLYHLSHTMPPSLADEDRHILAIVVRAALRGIDISHRYPAFYKRMLLEPELGKAFLAKLNADESYA